MNSNPSTSYIVMVAVITLVIGLLIGSWFVTRETSFGGVTVGNEYNATSTAPNNVYGAQTLSNFTVKTGNGSLGSVVITGANTGTINFYDATTTNKSKRTGQTATSSILIASIPPSLVAGTYVFDVPFNTALLVDVAGTMPTTTILYR
jgi:hypothetical protein